MIKRILTYYAGCLDEYLSRTRHQPEGLAEVNLVGKFEEANPNKVVVSLVNLEKDTSSDMSRPARFGYGFAGKGTPLMMNMYILLAAVFEKKRYTESLSVLSDTLAFIQSMPRFNTGKENCTVEVVPMSTSDLHNIWTTMGGQYYPSVICKVRGLVIESTAIVSGGSVTRRPNVSM